MSLQRPTPKPTGLGTRLIRVASMPARAWYSHGALVWVRNDRDEFLLVRERRRERGKWGLPGGFLNPMEDPAVGAARELREETKVSCDPADLEHVMEYRQPWARHYEHVFSLTAQGDGASRTRSFEISGQGWFAADDLPALTAAANEVLVRLQDRGLL
ncbi:NUDIX hydrolase [Nocardioides sp. MH1]|uniref:NUDIX hydrolase n=1 Tax=Nocardioides sp. MH1 TaxID=3242490 RepID=UPI00351FEAD0